jgi:hypothetical protein
MTGRAQGTSLIVAPSFDKVVLDLPPPARDEEGWAHLSFNPDQARGLAQALLVAADHAEAYSRRQEQGKADDHKSSIQ